jgi:hypothetical protein
MYAIRVALLLKRLVVLAVADQADRRKKCRDDRHCHGDAHRKGIGAVAGMFRLFQMFLSSAHDGVRFVRETASTLSAGELK